MGWCPKEIYEKVWEMIEEQRLVTPTDMGKEINEHPSKRGVILTRFLRNILVGVGIAIVLTYIEGGLWILNPLHLFRNGSSHTLASSLSNLAHAPLLLVHTITPVKVNYFWQ